MPVALALSPHLDDAAFSCGGTLATLAEAGWKVVMTTIFTATVADPKGFALACQTDKGLGPEIDYMALRRDEDRHAAEALGIAPPLHLPFREAPHRGYGTAPELFADPRDDDVIVDALGDAVSCLVGDLSPDIVFAPQAVGGHVDHVQLVRAISQARWTVPILWWRDFPYTVRDAAPKEPFKGDFHRLPERACRYSALAEARKGASCSAYATQLTFQFGGVEGLMGRLAGEARTERFRLAGTLSIDVAALFEAHAARG
ncbi:PIG-L family deacetylase [Methylobacterium sp. Leaf93]|uniref:PIG-L deacetylase family protein n=1 Tax=Methylobacterium sp. Leaf93 TaxID=1736249 RepID=UPI0006FD6354|nr:PIG-L family deacetylase [Methylobacterium sp. Leaf93]KQP03976.1 GlcNAc-PI de-N-acetylase [Methylobacterium sp. Leaf93]